MADRHISLPNPFSSGDVKDWLQRYEICAKANGWNVAAKATRLLTLLEGEALAIWLELSGEQQEDYGVAKGEIEKAMRPMGFIFLDDLHYRKLRPGEPISVFVHDLKKLIDHAIPNMEKEARDPLLLHQFWRVARWHKKAIKSFRGGKDFRGHNGTCKTTNGN